MFFNPGTISTCRAVPRRLWCKRPCVVAGIISPVGTWKRLLDFLFVYMMAASVGGAQLDVAPVSDTPEGRFPLSVTVLISSSSVMSGDQ